MKVHELWMVLSKPDTFILSDYGFVDIDVSYCVAEGDDVRHVTFCLRPERVDELPDCWLTHCNDVGLEPDCIVSIRYSPQGCHNRIFYSVENDCGHNVIHLLGNVYFNDAHDGDDCYRHAEWSGLVLTQEQIHALGNNFPDALYNGYHYMGNLTHEAAIKVCQTYFDGTPGVYMSVFDVNDKTPCGNYYMGGV